MNARRKQNRTRQVTAHWLMRAHLLKYQMKHRTNMQVVTQVLRAASNQQLTEDHQGNSKQQPEYQPQQAAAAGGRQLEVEMKAGQRWGQR
jgi:hypothetical protein